MRREATPFEVILWRHLSRSQLGGFKFRRQAVIEPFIVDFLCPLKSLIVEVDGDTHIGSEDQRRDALLATGGYRVLRFSNHEVAHQTEAVLQQILLALNGQPDRFSVTPHPNPSPEGEGLARAARALGKVSDTPRLDAEILLAHAAGLSRNDVLARSTTSAPGFDALVRRRLAGEPVAYITGTRGFWTVDLDVTPDVLIPRRDSETLIEAAVAHFGRHAPNCILDLGTGSGALLLAALDQWPEATGIGVDASAAALAVARRNGARIAPGRAAWRLGDWADGIAGQFDLVLCNPPYVEKGAALGPGVREWEPHGALFAGEDGLACYRVLATQIPALIAPGGIACIELGAGQFDAVAALFGDSGKAIGQRLDLGGHVRCLTLSDFPLG